MIHHQPVPHRFGGEHTDAGFGVRVWVKICLIRQPRKIMAT
jgi:hypothetical protein